MSIERTLLLREPGRVTFKGATLYSQGSITVAPVQSLASISTSVGGKIHNARVTNRVFRVTGVLAGEWEDLTVLFELFSKRPGQSLFPSNGDDQPLVINGVHGNKLTLKNAVITKPPQIVGVTGRTMFGQFEAMAIVGNDLDPAEEASYYVLATESYPGDAAFDVTKMLTLPLSATWGASAPWVGFATRGGWDISNTVELTMEDVDGVGTADITVKDMTVTATAIPAGPTRAEILTASGFGSGLGAHRAGSDLVLEASGVYIKLSAALMTDSGLAFGEDPAIGAATLTANRTWSSGAMVPLLVVDTEAP